MSQFSKLTIAKIKEQLDGLGVDYQNGLLKQQYIDLLEDATKPAKKQPPAPPTTQHDTSTKAPPPSRTARPSVKPPIAQPVKSSSLDSDSWESDNELTKDVLQAHLGTRPRASYAPTAASKAIPAFRPSFGVQPASRKSVLARGAAVGGDSDTDEGIKNVAKPSSKQKDQVSKQPPSRHNADSSSEESEGEKNIFMKNAKRRLSIQNPPAHSH
jgi:hypothetical protein